MYNIAVKQASKKHSCQLKIYCNFFRYGKQIKEILSLGQHITIKRKMVGKTTSAGEYCIENYVVIESPIFKKEITLALEMLEDDKSLAENPSKEDQQSIIRKADEKNNYADNKSSDDERTITKPEVEKAKESEASKFILQDHWCNTERNEKSKANNFFCSIFPFAYCLEPNCIENYFEHYFYKLGNNGIGAWRTGTVTSDIILFNLTR